MRIISYNGERTEQDYFKLFVENYVGKYEEVLELRDPADGKLNGWKIQSRYE